MFAVVDIAGQQHKVSPSERLHVPLLSDEVGSTVTFGRVLLTADDKKVQIGNPTVKNVAVTAKVLTRSEERRVGKECRL